MWVVKRRVIYKQDLACTSMYKVNHPEASFWIFFISRDIKTIINTI